MKVPPGYHPQRKARKSSHGIDIKAQAKAAGTRKKTVKLASQPAASAAPAMNVRQSPPAPSSFANITGVIRKALSPTQLSDHTSPFSVRSALGTKKDMTNRMTPARRTKPAIRQPSPK